MQGKIQMIIGLLLIGSAIKAAEFSVIDVTGRPIAGLVVEVIQGVQPYSRQSREVRQQNLTFVPEVLIAVQGDEVTFPNHDPFAHHVYSFSAAKFFELPLYNKGDVVSPISLDSSGVIELGCNIHDSMQGFIYVAQSPLVGQTGENGKLRLNLNDGSFSLKVWHPRMRELDVKQIYQFEHAGQDEYQIQLIEPMFMEAATSSYSGY